MKLTPTRGPPLLTSNDAFVIASRSRAVKAWIGQYSDVTHSSSLGPLRVWTVSYYKDDDEIAQVHIEDSTGRAYEVWTGPQVGWMLAASRVSGPLLGTRGCRSGARREQSLGGQWVSDGAIRTG